MSEELRKKAAEMLLNGATLLSEPCPYCKGVRVMKEGQALCTKCGREPEKREIIIEKDENPLKKTLERKLETLSKELEQEMNHDKQQDILKSINSVLEMIEKIK
ncbi:Sjogren's syndrome/scleroderma autoantigen 1 family protein [Nitrosopumilus sp.]|nr:Sjogren's syndrome/scleroderma autoantigen 1 family protein [Nitrosopumilus sp.]